MIFFFNLDMVFFTTFEQLGKTELWNIPDSTNDHLPIKNNVNNLLLATNQFRYS